MLSGVHGVFICAVSLTEYGVSVHHTETDSWACATDPSFFLAFHIPTRDVIMRRRHWSPLQPLQRCVFLCLLCKSLLIAASRYRTNMPKLTCSSLRHVAALKEQHVCGWSWYCSHNQTTVELFSPLPSARVECAWSIKKVYVWLMYCLN